MAWRAQPERYRLFVMLGALLLFMLEPMIGRWLQPAYGGGFHVWATCLMLFQGMLLLGYLYAHFLAPRLGRWHLVVAALSLLFLPIGVQIAPGADGSVLSISGVLLQSIAVPFIVLATTGVVAQAWFAHSTGSEPRDPYTLYSASNAGSLIGLLAYPLLVEPLLGLHVQQQLWTVACVAYLLVALWVAPPRGVLARRKPPEAGDEPAEGDPSGRLNARRAGYCLLLSMAPSISLLAVTNFLSAELGSVPLVWVAPLAIYLTSFVLVFGRRRRIPRLLERFWPEIALLAFALFAMPAIVGRFWVFAVQLIALFTLCLVGHGELHRVRPHPRDLTAYYLVMALGGWLGGIFVAVLAPHLFTRLHEYPIGIGLLMLTLGVARRSELRAWFGRREYRNERLLRALVAGPLVASVFLWLFQGGAEQTLLAFRNPYGIYRVYDRDLEVDSDGTTSSVRVRHLVHSGVTHGIQARERGMLGMPVGYYHPETPLGAALGLLDGPRRIAVIGLGAGATAAHFESGEAVVFYELDADNERVARDYFTYLDDTDADVRVVVGDARLEIERDPALPDGSLDVLLVDAFSGDAIPTHLLTLEALELYLRKLAPDGLLVCHISNRYYDLRPVLKSAGERLGLHGAFREPDAERPLAALEFASSYYVLTRNPRHAEALAADGWTRAGPDDGLRAFSPWSDDFVNILGPLWQRLSERALRNL